MGLDRKISEKRQKTFVIVNPNSAGGATMKRWPRVSEKLEKAIGKFDYDFTNAEGVATLFAVEAVKKGYEKIIAVGGDGTLHEIVQGLFKKGESANPDIVIGMIPIGTGTDFVRTLKISNDIDEAIVRLRGTKTKKIDVGLVEFLNHKGNKDRRYLINMADVGFGGDVAEKVNTSPKIFGGFGAYLFSSITAFVSYKPKKVRITSDNQTVERSVTSVIVANGQYCGGGMWVAPPALLDDGFFDVVIIDALSKWDLVSFAPRLYSGKLLELPGVSNFKTKSVAIESDEGVLVNIDGEQPGTTPVNFTVLPKALNFKV